MPYKETPHWDTFVQPILSARQTEANQKAEEQRRLNAQIEAQKLRADQEAQARREANRLELWGLLNQFRVKDLLISLNMTDTVWRRQGIISKREISNDPGWSRVELAEYSLSLPYQQIESSGGGEDPISSYIANKKTLLQIGVSRGVPELGYGGGSGGLKRTPEYRHFQGEIGLYVYDNSVTLLPIDQDAFPDIQPVGNNGVIVDVDFPQAEDILIELIKRSCINRTNANLLPWQIKERSYQPTKAKPSRSGLLSWFSNR